ncbi:hypothetical protein D3C86_1771470 [compost metagenome]
MQQRARGVRVVAVQRLVDIGEEMAELAEAQGQIQQQDVPGQRQRHADRRQQVVNQHGGYRERQHHGQPGQRGVAWAARVEGVFGPLAQYAHDVVNGVIPAQGSELFGDQRQKNGNKGHRVTVATDIGATAKCRSGRIAV